MTLARFGVIDTSLMSKSNGFGVGAITLLNAACTHLTLSAGNPSCLATAKATADSKPLPLAGLLSTNHGSNAGLSVATVKVPPGCVVRVAGEQSGAALVEPVAGVELPVVADPPPPPSPVLLAAQPAASAAGAAGERIPRRPSTDHSRGPA